MTKRRATYIAIAVALLWSPVTAASSGAIPDLSAGGAGWRNEHNDFILPKSGAGPVTWDPAHPYRGNGDGGPPTSRVADLSNPVLMPWVREALQKLNADALAASRNTRRLRAAGRIAFLARFCCG